MNVNTNGIIKYLVERYLLKQVNDILDGQFFSSRTAFNQINEFQMLKDELTNNQLTSLMVKLLKAGETHCLDGFVVVDSIHVLAPKELSRSEFVFNCLFFKRKRRSATATYKAIRPTLDFS